ncbi:vesicle transport through interaction with t-SNAREs homolog 1A-like [Symsagittifera roscoffensis]|uniref:vesicle transport through interaction with t-SNAREs homolog 1A-like n=1 Tax=Symsagittifera roscoffensis TaxID=84072 RepID=UPI00307BE7A5
MSRGGYSTLPSTAPSASLFESYEQQVASASAEITYSISKITALTESERQQSMDNIQRLLEDLKDTLEQMELESRDHSTAERNKYMTRLRSYRTEAKRLEEEFHAVKYPRRSLQQDRMELLGIDGDDQKQNLLKNSERIERGTRRLEAGNKVAIETEELGAEILRDLHEQGETIEKSRQRLRSMNADLGKSSRVLSAMLMRAIQHRIALMLIVLVLIAVAVIVIVVLTQTS